MKVTVQDFRNTLIETKSFAALALNLLENVSGEELPEDKKLNIALFALVSGLIRASERFEDLLAEIKINLLDE
jgi:hypothetical protein